MLHFFDVAQISVQKKKRTVYWVPERPSEYELIVKNKQTNKKRIGRFLIACCFGTDGETRLDLHHENINKGAFQFQYALITKWWNPRLQSDEIESFIHLK